MKKSFNDLVKQMKALEEPKQGQLKGGFTSFDSLATSHSRNKDTNVNVNVYDGATCACQCSDFQ